MRDLNQLSQLLLLGRRYRRTLMAGFLAVALSSILSIVPWRAVRYLVDGIIPGGNPNLLTRAALALVGIFAALAMARMASVYFLSLTGERIVLHLRMQLYQHLHSQSIDFFVQRRVGELVSRLTNDVSSVQGLLTSDLASALSRALVFVGALAMLFTTNWRLTLLMMSLVPAVAVSGILVGRRVRSLSVSVQDDLAIATTVMDETLGGMPVVQSFCRQDYEVKRYERSVKKAFEAAIDRIRVLATFSPTMSLAFGLVTSVVLYLGGREVLAGRLTPGELVEFIGLTLVVSGAISQFNMVWTRVQQALGSSQRLFELLATQPTIASSATASPLRMNGTTAGRIEIEEVVFRYPGRQAVTPALDRVSLDVNPGENFALVGPSGAGKTTLLRLIPRFYDPREGRVLVGGQDVRSVSLESLRGQIALVPQDPYIFGGTIRDNILYGKLHASDRQVRYAASAANADEFIERCPEGYDTIVGERGIKLSGGERQRLAIARAFLCDARILLLDEPTSALDAESEALVRDALVRLMEDRTTIVVAHRLSTIQTADRIAVLDAGRIVEIGTRRQLLARDGRFAQLCRVQSLDVGGVMDS